MRETANVIEMEQLSFRYAGCADESLRNITLRVKQGEFIVLTGVSGCGKTTLTRCVNGLIPDFFEGELRGGCRVHGMELSAHETGDFAGHVGSVFQDPRSQFFTLHVNTEIPFPGENLGIEAATIRESFVDTVEALGLPSLLGKSIFQLSSGEKQKVALASVRTAGVSTYVLDEPSANLDGAGTEQLRQALAALKAQGRTIILSEHKLHYLKEMADRVLVMDHGEIVCEISGEAFRGKSPAWLFERGLRRTELSGIRFSSRDAAPPCGVDIIRAEELSFRYPGGKPLWAGASFACEPGEIVGIVGKNGAGKSTLIRVLMGLERPRRGKVYLHGRYAPKHRRQKQSFYVMQDVDYQLFAPSVLEEMLSGHPENAGAIRRAREYLDAFGLGRFADVHPSQLSGGQKQRLSIALALMSEAPLVYLDEPTSGLDARNMERVRQAVRQLADAGRCVFVITHDYEFAAGLFSSLLVLRDGAVEHIGPDGYRQEQLLQYYETDKEKL